MSSLASEPDGETNCIARGRGLEIMRAALHETGIEREPGGTRAQLSRRLAR
jgi:hypothetical protein